MFVALCFWVQEGTLIFSCPLLTKLTVGILDSQKWYGWLFMACFYLLSSLWHNKPLILWGLMYNICAMIFMLKVEQSQPRCPQSPSAANLLLRPPTWLLCGCFCCGLRPDHCVAVHTQRSTQSLSVCYYATDPTSDPLLTFYWWIEPNGGGVFFYVKSLWTLHS